MSETQSVLFDRAYYSVTSARRWLKRHGYDHQGKVHRTLKCLRFRQKPPGEFKRFRTKRLTPSIELVIGFK